MKVIDLKGRSHPFNVGNYVVAANETRPRSDLHLKARVLLKAEYPTDVILEEVPVPGEHLFLDFFLPLRKLVVEVHGQQHFSYNSFFHASKKDFIAGKQNDLRKQRWCELNNFTFVTLPFNEDTNEWTRRIKEA